NVFSGAREGTPWCPTRMGAVRRWPRTAMCTGCSPSAPGSHSANPLRIAVMTRLDPVCGAVTSATPAGPVTPLAATLRPAGRVNEAPAWIARYAGYDGEVCGTPLRALVKSRHAAAATSNTRPHLDARLNEQRSGAR